MVNIKIRYKEAVQTVVQVSMNALVEGKGRKDASRWFFEMLVLKTRNYVNLKQEEPYGDISISATSKLLTAT
jgi:cohesin complex subunit SCC1